ncbi:hypothetical protein KBY85_15090 [Cyanobium sp. BA5m-10]|uniref:hypothetical protein n=1 Tax=Cyanobium sp. BA5m-10 TaxID=2823705 RepID=UPI0020CC87C4|nr:hypothetical protein [Cyanobium sp. BA5m-10]MCP9905449.1 hypothetical protein [Cyanobium sp. BA5m-10]
MRSTLQSPSEEYQPLALFEQRCRTIYRLTCKHGTEHALRLEDERATPESFRRACHIRFAEAQILILEELIQVQDSKKELNAKLKSARKGRDKLASTEVKQQIGLENLKEHIIRKLADSIAWHLIGGQNYIARRLCLRESSRPTLKASNLASVLNFVNEYNGSNPLGFALISDITSFVQLGDVLLIGGNGLQIIEVKEGAKNHESMSFIAENLLTEAEDEQIRKALDDHPLNEQIRRILRQHTKMTQATTLLNTGGGIDPATGERVQIPDMYHTEEHYFDELQNLITQLGPKKDWALTVLEGGLYIGAYKGVWRRLGPSLLRRTAYEEINDTYPVTSLREGLAQALVEPIFVKPLSEDQIFDITFGRVAVFILLRLDQMLSLYSGTPARAEFLSVKQSRKQQEKCREHSLFTHEGQCVRVVYPTGTSFLMGDGVRTRVVFDTLTPQCVVAMSASDSTSAV